MVKGVVSWSLYVEELAAWKMSKKRMFITVNRVTIHVDGVAVYTRVIVKVYMRKELLWMQISYSTSICCRRYLLK